MFADLLEPAIQPKPISEQIGAEIKLSDNLINSLKNMLANEENNAVNITATSGMVKVERNYVFFSNIWFYLAVLCKKYAQALYPYCKFFDERMKGNRHAIELLGRNDYDNDYIKGLFDSDGDKEKMIKFIVGGSDFRPGKALLNGTKIRATKDIFSSCILKKISVPDVSSNYLGNIVYYLAKVPELYDELETEIMERGSVASNNDIGTDNLTNVYGIHIKNKNDALSKDNPHICIGWSKLGDLTDISSKEELGERYDSVWPEANSRGRGQDIGQIYRFKDEMSIGDYIVFSEGDKFHIGRIESDYIYEPIERVTQDRDYTSNRKVAWLKKNISKDILSRNLKNSLGTAMSVWSLNDYKGAIIDILNDAYKKDDDEMVTISLIDKRCDKSHNRIISGAPGTGKSFKYDRDRKTFFSEYQYERVTFHPAYSYAHFFGCYKPVNGTNTIEYKFVPGPFVRMWLKAMADPHHDYLLLIEEINRADVAAVFGDVFQLLDRKDGTSQYPIDMSEDLKKYIDDGEWQNNIRTDVITIDTLQKMFIPKNMFIWATMNSADQGVYPMDTAFKRRWDYEYMSLNAKEAVAKLDMRDIDLVREKAGEQYRVQTFTWDEIRRAINDYLSREKINEDKLIGPFFLSDGLVGAENNLSDKDFRDKFAEAFKTKVLMYLFDDAGKSKRSSLFDGVKPDYNRYSAICEQFDSKGVRIFHEDIRNKVRYNVREALARLHESDEDDVWSEGAQHVAEPDMNNDLRRAERAPYIVSRSEGNLS